MKLEVICTGEEVLSGQIVDTNAAWFANTMMDHGIEIHRRNTIGDRLHELAAIFEERSHHADVILVNGGLGPTTDDLCAEAMALAMNEPLIENTVWRQHLEQWFSQKKRTMPNSNLKQALLPQSAIMINNPVGTACGFKVKFNQAWFFFTPGVPFEFKYMVKKEFIPFLHSEFDLINDTKVKKILTLGCAESTLQDKLSHLQLPKNITLGYRSSMPYIEIKIFCRGMQAIQSLSNITDEIRLILGNSLVTENISSLAEDIHYKLINSGKTLSLAESCTGGMLTSQLIDFAGSSQYLLQGLVTYSNQAKRKILGVDNETLAQFGAVSINTVEEMAIGARKILDSDYSLATSGIAGPDGGTKMKPVGSVAIALATRNNVYSQMITLPNRSRELVRKFSCAVAYDMLRRKLNNESVIVDYETIGRY